MSTSRPYLERQADRETRGRLLIVSWHFPPGQSAGALRWQKLAEHATERGWDLDVIALDPADLQDSDRTRLHELPPSLRVFGVRAPGLLPADRVGLAAWRARRRFRKLLGKASRVAGEASRTEATGDGDRSERTPGPPEARSWTRAWWAWRDHAQGAAWADAAAELGAGLARDASYDAIITSGPPHMAHEAGRRLSRGIGLPLVMDLRDPWSLPRRLPGHYDSPLWFALARRHERRCVEAASLVVVNTDPVREAMARAYPSRADRLLTVMNGHDDGPLPPPRFGERFLVAYAGGIYLDRDPRPLFRAAARVVEDLGLGPEAFGIELMGDVETFQGLPLRTIASQEGIEPYVRTHPPRPRREMLQFLAGAPVLVSLPQDSPYAVPSKVFEYMRFPAWLLVLAPPGSATAGLLEPTSAEVVDPADVEKIASALRSWHGAYANGCRPSPVASDGAFDRRTQAKRLFDVLDDIVGRTA